MSLRAVVRACAAILAASMLLAGTMWQAVSPATLAAPTLFDIMIPDDALWVGPDHPWATIDDALAAAKPGDTIAVDGGAWSGPIEIATEGVRLIGVDNPIIDGNNTGTVVHIIAPDVVFQGFTVQNSGSNFDKEDSAIVVTAERVHILNNRLLNTLFGINAATAHDSVFAGNTIIGKDVDLGVRGDGIKVWYSHRVQIIGNDVELSRDSLVWYSDDVVVSDNTIRNSRYGFHFMNSNNGVVERNRLENNSVAIYLMYGRNFTIRDNLLQGSRGPSGHGLGLKEIDGVLVEGNIIYDNRIGVFIDNSPLSPKVYSYFRENLIAYNDHGFGVLPSSRNNVLSRNSMIDNLEQVTVLGGGKLGANEWSENGVGNFWSDYAGYDADGDGIGDIPFKSVHVTEQLMASFPQLQLFRFSLAETAVDFGSRALPLFRQDPTFIDPAPLVSPVIPAGAPRPTNAATSSMTTLWAVLLLIGAAGALWWGVRGTNSGVPKAISGPNRVVTGARRAESAHTPMGDIGQ